ncbi:MAG: tRNA (adenosine(37)-N6)-threonylcarbamoyltransferase complex ATPase subunit type 1 TsaE [Deltaproteobacteria bacterium]|nr:tRNA (adenosine(37)-N6)-threonylcarbamoyltransferase complex ATPase subunit type 1 TsaE [Deltaproteobacteria bacterium]
MTQLSFETRSEDETLEWARKLGVAFAESARSGIAVGSVFVALIGPLGAGKTVVTRGIVSGVDPQVAEEVRSPTFAIVDELPTDPPIRHLDLYRLSGLLDLEAIGYREIYEANGMVIVEWADRVAEALPPERIEIWIEPEDVRRIRVVALGALAERLVARAWS